MSITKDLYELWRKADSLEVYEKMKEREYEEVVKSQDVLLVILTRLKGKGAYKPKDEYEFVGCCRQCDAYMSLKPWAE